MWQIVAAITGTTYVTSSQATELEMERYQNEFAITTKGRGDIHQVKYRKQQQPKHSVGGEAG